MIESVKRGQLVTFKPEWQDAGDNEITFRAIEDSCERVNGTMTVAVIAELGLPINPVQVASLDMIESCE